MKIAIYTISKNELQFVDRWVASVQDADYLVVADTGSTDGTIKLLQSHNVAVHNISVSPWRFDDARNAALALVPGDADICISMDMDELMAPGWRASLERAWTEGTTRLRYTYVWSFDANDQPMHSFMGDKCHSRHNYRWRRPVHETVFATGDETVITAPEVIMWHKQDHSKSRGQYLHLLEQSHRENPTCHQTLFWLAREYAYYSKQEEAVAHFKKYLEFEGSWHEERSESQRWLSKLLPHDKLYWLRSATAVAPMRREPWVDLADYYYHAADWLQCMSNAVQALAISHKSNSYLETAEAWGAKPYDLAGIAAWNLGLKQKAVEYISTAAQLAPEDQRIQNNLQVVLDSAKDTQ